MQIVLFVAGDIMTAPNMTVGVKYVYKHDQLRTPQPTPRLELTQEESELRVPQATSCCINERMPASSTFERAMALAGRGSSFGAGLPARGSAGSRCAASGAAVNAKAADSARTTLEVRTALVRWRFNWSNKFCSSRRCGRKRSTDCSATKTTPPQW